MTNAERIVQHLTDFGEALCDDCLSEGLGITPQQTVNSACRRMVKIGTVARENGICARCNACKIVNTVPMQTAHPVDTSEPVDTDRMGITPTIFEERVGAYLQRTYNKPFSRQSIPLGDGKTHEADWISADGKILVECKSYTWTRSGNVPSAKISTLREAILYLKACPGEQRIIAMHHLPFPGRELLADYFCRLNRGLLNGVEVWDFIIGACPDEDVVRVVVDGGKQ